MLEDLLLCTLNIDLEHVDDVYVEHCHDSIYGYRVDLLSTVESFPFWRRY